MTKKKYLLIGGVLSTCLSHTNTLSMDQMPIDFMEMHEKIGGGGQAEEADEYPELISSSENDAQSLRQSLTPIKNSLQDAKHLRLLDELINKTEKKEIVLRSLDDNSISKKIYNLKRSVNFGQFNVMSDPKFKESNDLFDGLFPDKKSFFTFKAAVDYVDDKIKNLELKDKLSIAKSFRHLLVDKNIHHTRKNQLGDFISEHVLINMLKVCDPADNLNLFSDICYELSQTYSHLLEFSMGKVEWFDNDDMGSLVVLGDIAVSFSTLQDSKLSLLKMALTHTSDHANSWIRLTEYFLYDRFDNDNYDSKEIIKQVPKDLMFHVCEKWTANIGKEGTYPAPTKKAYINKTFKEALAHYRSKNDEQPSATSGNRNTGTLKRTAKTDIGPDNLKKPKPIVYQMPKFKEPVLSDPQIDTVMSVDQYPYSQFSDEYKVPESEQPILKPFSAYEYGNEDANEYPQRYSLWDSQ